MRQKKSTAGARKQDTIGLESFYIMYVFIIYVKFI